MLAGHEEGHQLGVEEGRLLGRSERRRLGVDEGHNPGLIAGHRMGMQAGERARLQAEADVAQMASRAGQQSEMLRPAVAERDAYHIALDQCAVSTGKKRAQYEGQIRDLRDSLQEEQAKNLGLEAWLTFRVLGVLQ